MPVSTLVSNSTSPQALGFDPAEVRAGPGITRVQVVTADSHEVPYLPMLMPVEELDSDSVEEAAESHVNCGTRIFAGALLPSKLR